MNRTEFSLKCIVNRTETPKSRCTEISVNGFTSTVYALSKQENIVFVTSILIYIKVGFELAS